ncbi:class F sortase [Labedaea rhizosphaerae]|uniref:LPXTG-site transpeptidase (Sortase) family protein n=1 Tax=Labedaea rhizosphaerae TaxID=598644 RepID=A0A4R6RZU5_LABRH|nr:class F sortase [Labedaea rhizosphaerae]TDP91836.1 LPXTG-site transpeptidase (sortase) family protein [Labedaea rhizosphaerae]
MPRRALTAVVAVLAIVMVVAAVLGLAGCGAAPSGDQSPPQAHPAAVTRGLAPSVPVSVDVPSIDAHSSLVPLGVNPDHTIEVPPVAQPLQAGWYTEGPTPGEVGPAVILGHIDGHHQKGIFWRLHELRTGDKVSVRRQDGGTLTFTVYKVDQVAKSAFPTEAVYGNTTRPELRLITCGGAYDARAHSYLDNILVFAALDQAVHK